MFIGDLFFGRENFTRRLYAAITGLLMGMAG